MKLKVMLAVVSLLSLVSCTNTSPIVCTIDKDVAKIVSGVIAGALTCSDSDAILADVTAKMAGVGFCTSPSTTPAPSPVAGKAKLDPALCSLGVSAALALVGQLPPAAWKCSLTTATGIATPILMAACQAIPGP